MGLRWLLAPRGIAPEFGLTLQSGVGLSSQIGDMAAFFCYWAFVFLLRWWLSVDFGTTHQ
jgi:hypothetical protein